MADPIGSSSPAGSAPPKAGASVLRGSRARLGGAGDLLLRAASEAAALLVIVLFLLIVLILTWKAWLAIETIGLRFFTQTTWDPEPNHRRFGALAFIYGTVATSLIALAIAVPLGVGTAAFLSEIAPGWLRRVGSFFVEMLAAIPSVVYGFWGAQILAPYFQRVTNLLGGPNTGGSGILPAGIVLSIMIVPYVAAISYDVCRAVPSSQRAGSLALGATRWQTIWRVVLPYARPGILGGCFLALGRALGETMAVTMLIGNNPEISFSPFAMGDSIASAIANQFTEATYDLYLSALIELGLVLLVVSVIMNSLARLLIWRVSQVGKRCKVLAWRSLLGKPAASANGAAAAAVPAAASPPAGPVPAGTPGRDSAERPVEADPSPPPVARTALGPSARAVVIDRLMTGGLGLTLALTIVPLVLIMSFLLYEGFGALNLNFFLKLPPGPGEEGGGLANAIYGSAMIVGLATLFAVPVGLLAAIFLSEYRSDRLGPAVRFVGELLSGVPSIVMGLFVYALVVKPMGHFSGWAGAFALGIMMIPIVMRASEESLKLVPRSLRDASYALGASQAQTVLRVSVPAALPAIITGVFLAIARIGGETAPLLLTAFSNKYYPLSPNDSTPSLPVYIFNYAVSPYANWHRLAWAAALVLLVAVMFLNFGIRVLTGKRVVSAARAD